VEYKIIMKSHWFNNP